MLNPHFIVFAIACSWGLTGFVIGRGSRPRSVFTNCPEASTEVPYHPASYVGPDNVITRWRARRTLRRLRAARARTYVQESMPRQTDQP